MPAWAPLLAGMTMAAVAVALWQALHGLHPASSLGSVALGVGLVQSVLLYLVLHFARGTRERARQLRQLNTALQAQMDSVQRAEKEVQAKQAYTRSLIEASLDPLVTVAADGKITDVNAATEKVTGVDRGQLLGSDFSNYFTQPDQARAGYEQAFAQGLVKEYPLAIRHRSGRVTDVVYNASVFRDESGKVQGVFAAARDITERKQAEQALRWSEERYRALLIASAQVVWTTPPTAWWKTCPCGGSTPARR
jgi:PAS domain S-box-containing protein